MKKKVLMLMSGGVDSSLAAYILKKEGYEVIGCTMRLFLCKNNTSGKQCCSPDDINVARLTAQQLGIKHYVIDKTDIFNKHVIDNFISEYFKGRTPNPCIVCNLKIKFDFMLRFAKGLGCDFLATGHYAKIEKTNAGYLLKKGIDNMKDQSYFLYGLTQKNLPHILFPLGDYKKTEIRKMAKELNLKVADKKESQEICFVEGADYRGFLKTQINADKIKTGNFIDTSGKILGIHKGLPFYTIGQRHGLGLSVGYPIFVTKIDTVKNEITVGKKEDLLGKEFSLEDVSWTTHKPKKFPIAAKVRIRYKNKESKAKIFLDGRDVNVEFSLPQMSITPGQSAVFYKKDMVLGGGLIKKVSN
ncbi:MAG: tRNA 2-thiouridine(34) synthase MnmA [Elusimicrobia bacterium]|nr:tRNA 2-thiouridine(34) synthase MnmA [Elusimicrobiota bacterium]